ncbi:S-methyl-5-thioribose-1-phosphate isomerase [Alphaproteobacteria bacterium]|nr:S-methyl-5-thioribose-1-phosphate isomerase [Alphaproteobacteria bacterium]
MKIDNQYYRTIWENKEYGDIDIIDQTLLPHRFKIITLTSVKQTAKIITDMNVRGAPLIGATGAYGMCLAVRENSSNKFIEESYEILLATRPTAINLKWALEKIKDEILTLNENQRLKKSYEVARKICNDDIQICEKIGNYGLKIIKKLYEKNKRQINILTHCNAGWLATIDWGTATAPIYMSQKNNIPVHVWVDETRPRNQGANITSYELKNQNIDHTVIVDNAGGHLMQSGLVDICIVGTDRTTYTGDVTNKIGTYLKALAAKDNNIPFYVALPSTTIDWNIRDGLKDVKIEERSSDEVHYIQGLDDEEGVKSVRLTPKGVKASNYAFDTTPRRFITGLITERGILEPNEESIKKAFNR